MFYALIKTRTFSKKIRYNSKKSVYKFLPIFIFFYGPLIKPIKNMKNQLRCMITTKFSNVENWVLGSSKIIVVRRLFYILNITKFAFALQYLQKINNKTP